LPKYQSTIALVCSPIEEQGGAACHCSGNVNVSGNRAPSEKSCFSYDANYTGRTKSATNKFYFRFFSYLAIEVEVLLLCPKRNVLRRENIRAKPYRCWESRGSLSPRRVRARSQT
jgi:hypothetical protein